jgi:SMC interacting uncharacterized protein involved in chromosome segregation
MEDPRNVRDKNFIRNSLQRLIEYLVENNYDRQISPKQLEAPTTKDFLHILTFLYNKIDPKFVLGPNIAEDVPAMFKRLRYTQRHYSGTSKEPCQMISTIGSSYDADNMQHVCMHIPLV